MNRTSSHDLIDRLVHAALVVILIGGASTFASCSDEENDPAPRAAERTILPGIVRANTDVGTLGGDFSVSPRGTATYAIPLWTPDGRNGLTPQMTLSYASTAGDNAAGFGWSVTGTFSLIHRCGSTSPRIDRPTALQFEPADQLCLDGHPLILVSGTHGSRGAEYRTEPDTFSKVVIDAVGPDGPARFTVYSRDTLIHSYGSEATLVPLVKGALGGWLLRNNTSRDDGTVVAAAATTATYGWLRASTSDRFSNQIFFRYRHPPGREQAGGTQEPLIDTIEYVDVDGGAFRTRSIKFNYVNRAARARRSRWVGGMQFTTNTLLSSIDVRVAKPGTRTLTTARFYELTHELSPTTTRPLLKQVRECAATPPTDCKRPTFLNYSLGATTFRDSGAVIPELAEDPTTPVQIQPADINGDGRTDIVTGRTDTVQSHVIAYLSGDEGFSGPIPVNVPGLQPNLLAGDMVVADFAGSDGLPDFAIPVADNGFAFFRNHGFTESEAALTTIATDPGFPTPAIVTGDFAGKGRPSILRPLFGGQWGYTFAKPGPFGDGEEIPAFAAGFGATWSFDFLDAGWNGYAVDLDADGASDFLTLGSSQAPSNRLTAVRQLKSPTPDGTPSFADWQVGGTTTLLTSATGDLVKHIFFDFNGDGLPDALRLRQGRQVPDLIINTGKGFAPPRPLSFLAGTSANIQLGAGTQVNDLNDPGIRIIDFDGDGRQDILLVDDGTVRDSSAGRIAGTRRNLWVLLSRGDTFELNELAIPIGLPGAGPTRPSAPGISDWRFTQVLDFNGDGLTDIFQVSPGDRVGRVLLRDGTLSDRLIHIKDGMGQKIDVSYRPLSDRTVYRPLGPGILCDHPLVCIDGITPLSLGGSEWPVSSYRVDSGVGDEQNEFRCTYEDGRVDLSGAGFLGFSTWTWTDVRSGAWVRRKYNLNAVGAVSGLGPARGMDRWVYSEIGFPSEEVAFSRPALFVTKVATQKMTYEFVPTNQRKSHYTRLKTVSAVEEETRTTPGLPRRTIETSAVDVTMTYDPALNDFGVTSGAVTNRRSGTFSVSEDRFSSTLNFPERWLVGLEHVRRVSSRTRNGTPVARRIDFNPDPLTGALKDMTIEPETRNSDEFQFVEFGRHPGGQLRTLKRTDSRGAVRSVTIDYDAQLVHPAKYTNLLGHETVVERDPALGVVNLVRDPNQVTTTMDHDSFGRLRRVNQPGGGGMSVTYTRLLEPGSPPESQRFVTEVVTTHDGGGELRTLTDRLGRQIRSESKNLDGSYSYVKAGHDHHGLLKELSRPALRGAPQGPTTILTYDNLGRLIQRQRPDDGIDLNGDRADVATFRTTHSGLVAESVDDLGRVSRITASAFGHLLKTEDRNDEGRFVPTDYAYGPFGDLRSVTRKDGTLAISQQTVMDYDKLGRRTSITDPDTGTRRTRYNGFGEVREEVDAANSVTTYIRDPLGRVREQIDKDGTTTFVWDTAANGRGNLAETVSPSGVTRRFTYDVFGRLQTETVVSDQSYQIEYVYDASGRLEKTRYPQVAGFSRFVTRNVYDADSGALAQVVNDATGASYWQLVATTVDGQIARESFGNQAVTDYGYSFVTGRLSQIDTKPSAVPGPSPVRPTRAWKYDYFVDGRLRWRSDDTAGQHELYRYDNLGRLKTWSAANSSASPLPGGWAVDYTIDDFGNLTRRNFTAGTATGGSSQDLQYTMHAGTNRVASSFLGQYGYDDNGNQITRPGGETVRYTAFDLPKEITGPRAATFRYDATGGRVEKRRSITDFTVYVGGIYEKRVAGATTDHVFYVTAGGRVVAQVMRQDRGAESTVFLHAERQGSIDTVTDGRGAVVEQAKFDPFGNRITNFNQPALPTTITAAGNRVRLGYTGHEQDDDLGLVNMQGRLYDARLARFLTPDPFVADAGLGQSYNRYSYVLNDPLNLVDPTGFLPGNPDEAVTEDGRPPPKRGEGKPGDEKGESGDPSAPPRGPGTAPPPPRTPPSPSTGGAGSDSAQGPGPLSPDQTGMPQGAPGGPGAGPGSGASTDGAGTVAPTAPPTVLGGGGDRPWDSPVTGGEPPSNRHDAFAASDAGGFTIRDGASMLVGLIPGVGTAQSIVELITGRDFIAGRETSRWMAAAGIIAGLLPGGRAAVKGSSTVAEFAAKVVGATEHAIIDRTRRQAFQAQKEAWRIPRTQQPSATWTVHDPTRVKGPGVRDPNPRNQGRIYEYEIATPGGGTRKVYVIDHHRDAAHGGIGHIHRGVPKPGASSVEPGGRYTEVGELVPYSRR